jgi:HlyD family secretion protein
LHNPVSQKQLKDFAMTDVSNTAATAVTATPWRRLLIAAVILATIAGVTAYRKQTQALDVQVSHVTKGDLTDSILASGNLVYRTQVALRSELMARVDAVFVQEGDKVEAGQLLLQLDPQSYSASLEQARAQTARARTDIQMAGTRLKNVERQLKRQQQLANKGLIQQELLDNLQSEKQLALLQQQAAEQQLAQSLAAEKQATDLLAKTELRSPISGVIVAVDVKAGETVIPGSAQMMGSDLMTIADTSALLAELRLDEADVHSVFVGQQVKVFAAAAPDQALTGKVQSISSSARQLGQSQALAFKVKVLLENAENALYPGMSCRAELQTAALSQVWSVPVSALQTAPTAPVAATAAEKNGSAGKNSRQVWLVRDGRAYPQSVEVGLATDTAQQISAGLVGTEQVITGPTRIFASLKAGTKVRFDAPVAGAKP